MNQATSALKTSGQQFDLSTISFGDLRLLYVYGRQLEAANNPKPIANISEQHPIKRGNRTVKAENIVKFPTRKGTRAVSVELPERVTYEAGRCHGFADRVMNHYELEKCQPRLMLNGQRAVMNVISIAVENLSKNSLTLVINCFAPVSAGGKKSIVQHKIELNGDINSPNYTRLVDFNIPKTGEKCLGWESKNSECPTGFLHFQLPSEIYLDSIHKPRKSDTADSQVVVPFVA